MSPHASNWLKTFMLFALLWVVVLGFGALLSWGTGDTFWLWVFLAIGLGSTFYTYWNSATVALKQMQAVQVTREQAPGLYAIVEDLSSKMNMPMPTVWISPTQTPNAFATGRNPENAAVCCTRGILNVLDERQLRGVLGHELMHVYNRDILTASVASGLAGIATTMAQFVWMSGRSSNRGNGGMGALGGIVAMLLAPMAASVLRLGISRTREFSADYDGAVLTQDPRALASALATIHNVTAQVPLPKTPDTESASALMIANPFRTGAVSGLFSTHPSMEERIARLNELAGQLESGETPH